MLVAEKKVQWDRLDEKNVFRRDRVVLNLSGMKGYNPTRPLVYKTRSDERIATDMFWYINAGRLI